MKIRLTLLTLIAGLMAFNANAQDNPPPQGGGRPGGAREGGGRTRQAPTAEEIKAYDKNADGKLEGQEEMTALREGRQKEREKKYDANGDGKLDEEERKKMDAENPRRGPGGPGAGGPAPTAEEIKTYDKNGDGKLEGEEAVALRQARQKAMTEKYDTDKDGKLSDEERQKMMEEFRRNRPEGGGRPGGRNRPNAGGDGEKKTDAAPKIPVPGGEPAPEAK